MLVDGIKLFEGSNATNLVVAAGPSFPSLPDLGELFYSTSPTPGLFTYDGTDWVAAGGGGGGSGTVTSIGVSANGTYAAAISIGSSPITSAGTITITPNVFSAGAPGVVPLSGGGTTNFLRADGTWVAPPTPSLFTSGTSGIVSASGGGTTNFLRADGTWAAAGSTAVFTSITDGLTPASGGGSTTFLRADGTWTTPAGGTGNVPYDIVLSIENKPTANAVILTFSVVRDFTIPNGFPGSHANSGASDPATSLAVFTITKNGTTVGTVSFAGASTTGTFSGAGQTFAAGDVLRILSPAIQDETLANVGITIKVTIA